MVLTDTSVQHRLLKLIRTGRFGFLEFVVLEEVDQVTLMRLQHLLACKLVHAQLFDDLQNVHLLAELALSTLEKEVISGLLGATAEAVRLVEAPQEPEATILVGEGLPLLDLLLDFRLLLVVSYLGVELLNLLGEPLGRLAPKLGVQRSEVLVSRAFIFVIVPLFGRVKLLDQTVGKGEALA